MLAVIFDTLYHFATLYQVYSSMPKAPSLRERNIQARRQKILTAARVLLSEGGIKALSMRKLAEHAALSVNTLYNLWGTREEILRAITLDAKQQMEAMLDKLDSPQNPIEYCRFRMAAHIQEICRQHDLFRPMILAWLEGEIAGQPSPVEPMAQSIQGLSQVIVAACEQGILANTLNAECLALQIHQGSQFAFVQWTLSRIDDQQFEVRALYGLNLTFLGLAQGERRAEMATTLQQLEKKLQVLPS